MKVLKESGKYLEEQTKSNQKTAIIFLIIGLLTFIIYGLGIIFISISIYFFSKSSHYSRGIESEFLVTNSLRKLGKKYYLLNDINLPEAYGNIDHAVLGPNGIFVIESKDFKGNIRCDGDKWYQYKESWKWPIEHEIKSPSKQVKRNAVKLKQFIQKTFKKPIWVEGIVVFTNPNVKLELNNSTVPILKVEELCNFIKNKKSKVRFSSKGLASIGRIILIRGKGNFT